MNRIIDAYQNIVAPEGLAKRIEAQIPSAGRREALRGRIFRFVGSGEKGIVVATMICLAIAVWGVGHSLQKKDAGESVLGIRLVMESGDVLGLRQMPIQPLSDHTEHVTAVSWITEDTCATMFWVKAEQPVTFRTETNSLSMYEEENAGWTACENELVIESEGILCVVLPIMGEDEVFCIEMSSAGKNSRIEIVYDEIAGEYKAACKTNNGK